MKGFDLKQYAKGKRSAAAPFEEHWCFLRILMSRWLSAAGSLQQSTACIVA